MLKNKQTTLALRALDICTFSHTLLSITLYIHFPHLHPNHLHLHPCPQTCPSSYTPDLAPIASIHLEKCGKEHCRLIYSNVERNVADAMRTCEMHFN